MLKTILGADEFRKGCDYYFDTLDGTAATVEQFITCFETTSGQDLSQFMRWYEQAGTPQLKVRRQNGRITFSQSTQPTPGQAKKLPQIIPIRWQAIGDNGPIGEPELTILDTASTSFEAPHPEHAYSLSVLQDFSAPTVLITDQTSQDALRLMANDPNAFNRWEAGQSLARQLLGQMSIAIEKGRMPKFNTALLGYVDALKRTLNDSKFDNNFKALALTVPSNSEVQQSLKHADPIAIDTSAGWLRRAISDGISSDLLHYYHELKETGPFNPEASSAGRRALKNRCLSLLASSQDPQAAALAIEQFHSATNMTDELSALIILDKLGGRRVDQSMQDFYVKWKDTPLVIDKWFAVQASRQHPGGIEAVKELTRHPAFDTRNPNRVRALVGGLAMNNPHLFHHIDGSGYRFFTEQVLDMDSRNPSVAARLLGVYEIWRKLDVERQAMIKGELSHVIASNPSKNVLEIAEKTLG